MDLLQDVSCCMCTLPLCLTAVLHYISPCVHPCVYPIILPAALTVAVVKDGKKVVCGSQSGVLSIFSWGYWNDCSDRFPGHPESVDALVSFDEDTVISGSSDGVLRVLSVQPNKLLGVVGAHADMPVERLALSADRRLLASASHDNTVQLWDLSCLHDEGDDGVDDDGQDEQDDGNGIVTLDSKPQQAVAGRQANATAEVASSSMPACANGGTADLQPEDKAKRPLVPHEDADGQGGIDSDSDDDSDGAKQRKRKRKKREKTRMTPANNKPRPAGNFFSGLL